MRNSSFDDYSSPSLKRVVVALESGKFGHPHQHVQLLDTIRHQNDHYLVAEDFEDYIKAQEKVDQVYKDQERWVEMSIKNSIRSTHFFSSDRTIK